MNPCILLLQRKTFPDPWPGDCTSWPNTVQGLSQKGTSNATADYLSLTDSQLVDEPSGLLHEKMEKYLAKDEIIAVVDVTENGDLLKEGLKQVRDYLTTMSSARTKKSVFTRPRLTLYCIS